MNWQDQTLRGLDILFSLSAVIVALPLLVVVALVNRFTGEGEVFYTQTRIGRNGQPFQLLKFATMLKNSPTTGTGTFTVNNDPRILPFGHFLRKTSINELPQLFHILSGRMSVIGPRPHTPACYRAYPPELFAEVTSVRPGLAGLGAIVLRDEAVLQGDAEDNETVFYDMLMPYKGRVDQYAVRRHSVGMYFKIIILTCWKVIRPESDIVLRWFPDLPRPDAAMLKMFHTDAPKE
jgi:lipopolysaccharide/colanic/teichoic acid biosynthesis glycosyltransferase